MTQDREGIKFLSLVNKEKPGRGRKPNIVKDDASFEYCCKSLPAGKYDIDYVIKMLEILIEQCDYHALKKHDLPQSLRQSCKSMIAKLKVEKLGNPVDPHILVTCSKCKEGVVFPKRIAHLWVCPCENGTKMLEMLN